MISDLSIVYKIKKTYLLKRIGLSHSFVTFYHIIHVNVTLFRAETAEDEKSEFLFKTCAHLQVEKYFFIIGTQKSELHRLPLITSLAYLSEEMNSYVMNYIEL